MILRNRTLLALSIAVSMTFTGIGMVVPVRVLYAQSHGASLAVIGAMGSSFLLANFLFQYPTGWLADLWGRKRLMVIGLVAQAILSLVYLTISDPVLFVVVRVVEGIVSASVLPSARALVAASVGDDQRGKAYGIFGGFLNAGFLFGPALGGLFASAGYTPAFLGSAGFRLAALLVILIWVPWDQHARSAEHGPGSAVSRRELFSLPLVGSYILVFGDYLYLGFDLTLVPLWLRHDLGAPVSAIGFYYVLWAIPSMIVTPIGGRIADQWPRSTLILIFGLAQVPVYVAYGLANAAAVVLVVVFLHGIVYAMTQPAVDANLADASPPHARARTQGLYSAIGLGSAFFAANALGVLYNINFRLPLFAMGVGYGLCIIAGGTMIAFAERRGLVPVAVPGALEG